MCVTKPRLAASHAFVSSTLVLASLLPVWWASEAAGATINVIAETSDRILFSGGTARPTTEVNARIGQGFASPSEATAYVLPFKLPDLPPHERIVTATLAVNLEGWSNFSGFLRNLDIFGINIASSTNNAFLSENYVNGVSPSTNPHAVLLQDNFLTPTDINTSSASGQVKAKQSQDFGAYLQKIYDGGASAGQYTFLSIAHDFAVPSGQMRYYLLTSADGTNALLPKPKLVITTAGTEYGGSYHYLDPASTSSAEDGSASAPWKTFAAAQANLHAGDVLYCTGTIADGNGEVKIRSTDPVGTAAVMVGGVVYTPAKPITYARWPGRPQPHIKKLTFRDWGSSYGGGSKVDRHLRFVDFKFSPGEYDSADYLTNNAIFLSTAWHVEFQKCLIEGAKLNVPVKGADPYYGVDPAKGFFPYTPLGSSTPPAITAGSPGDASYITFNDCEITNCATGIMVTADYRYPSKAAKHWTITNNRITNTSEDAIRIAGGGASGTVESPSVISNNAISDQNVYKQAFTWTGAGDMSVWNARKWYKVRQRHVDNKGVVTFATAVVYRAEPDPKYPVGPAGESRIKLYLLADDKDFVPNRSKPSRWVMENDPLLYFDPTYVYLDPATNTLKTAVGGGDSAHTDCISIMGPTHDVLLGGNRVNIAEAGGPLKIEGIKISGLPPGSGHPYNITFENNLFYSNSAAGSGIILAGGRDIVFRHNVIFAGPDAPLARPTRFNKAGADEEPVPYGVRFYNNIIGGGGSTTPASAGYRNLATTENTIWFSQPLEGYNDASTNYLGPGDVILPGWEAVKFHDPKGPLNDEEIAEDDVPDYSLDPGSPAINFGSPLYQTTGNQDITGYPRQDGAPDAGAYEVRAP